MLKYKKGWNAKIFAKIRLVWIPCNDFESFQNWFAENIRTNKIQRSLEILPI